MPGVETPWGCAGPAVRTGQLHAQHPRRSATCSCLPCQPGACAAASLPSRVCSAACPNCPPPFPPPLQAKDQETNTEAESTDDDEEPGVTSHEVCGVCARGWVGGGASSSSASTGFTPGSLPSSVSLLCMMRFEQLALPSTEG